MALHVTLEQLRAEVRKLLVGIDLKTFTIGKLRASVETALGLNQGDLAERKAELTELVQTELANQETPTPAAKKQKVEAPPPGAAQGKDKKDKKVKKEKKEKVEKVEKKSKDKKDKKQKEKYEAIAEAEAMGEAEDEPGPHADAPDVEEEGLEAEATLVELEPDDKEPEKQRSGLLSGSEDGGIRFWDQGRCLQTLDGHTGAVHALVVNWESLEAVSGADDSSKLWSLKFGGCIRTMSDCPEGATAVAADWGGHSAVAGCGNGSCRVWSLKTADLLHKFTAHRGGVWALQWNFKEGYLASAGDEAVKIWDSNDWTCLFTTPGHAGGLMCMSVNWSESKILGGCGSTSNLQLWNCAADSFSRAKEGEKTKAEKVAAVKYHGHQDVVPDLAVDWGRSIAVTGGWDATLIVWNLKTGMPTHSHECKFGRVRSLAVDFANSLVWCGSSNGYLHQMDLRSGLIQKSLEGHGGAVTAVSANVDS